MNTLSGKKIRIITVILTYSLTIARNSTFMCVRIKAAILNKKFRLFLFHLHFSSKIGHLFLSCSTTCRTFYWSCFTEWAAASKIRAELNTMFCWVFTTLMVRTFLREDFNICLKNVTKCLKSSVRNWSSICKMFIVNQEPAKSAEAVVWVTFLGNVDFPKWVPLWSGLS